MGSSNLQFNIYFLHGFLAYSPNGYSKLWTATLQMNIFIPKNISNGVVLLSCISNVRLICTYGCTLGLYTALKKPNNYISYRYLWQIFIDFKNLKLMYIVHSQRCYSKLSTLVFKIIGWKVWTLNVWTNESNLGKVTKVLEQLIKTVCL